MCVCVSVSIECFASRCCDLRSLVISTGEEDDVVFCVFNFEESHHFNGEEEEEEDVVFSTSSSTTTTSLTSSRWLVGGDEIWECVFRFTPFSKDTKYTPFNVVARVGTFELTICIFLKLPQSYKTLLYYLSFFLFCSVVVVFSHLLCVPTNY